MVQGVRLPCTGALHSTAGRLATTHRQHTQAPLATMAKGALSCPHTGKGRAGTQGRDTAQQADKDACTGHTGHRAGIEELRQAHSTGSCTRVQAGCTGAQCRVCVVRMGHGAYGCFGCGVSRCGVQGSLKPAFKAPAHVFLCWICGLVNQFRRVGGGGYAAHYNLSDLLDENPHCPPPPPENSAAHFPYRAPSPVVGSVVHTRLQE